jgi:hypothetical protein
MGRLCEGKRKEIPGNLLDTVTTHPKAEPAGEGVK